MCNFRVNWPGSKIRRFWAKSLGYSPWLEHGRFWQVMEIAPNSLKHLLKHFKIISNYLCDCLCRFRVNSPGSKFRDFEQKAWAIAHGFEQGRFGQVMEIAPNSLKHLLNPFKIISNYFCDCLCRFRVNSPGSKISRISAKSLGYSPWFWTWPIWACPGNRYILSETPPKPS